MLNFSHVRVLPMFYEYDEIRKVCYLAWKQITVE